MKRRILISTFWAGVALAGAGFWALGTPAAQAGAQQSTDQPTVTSPEVIKSESQMVLVDVIATNKKDLHLTDLTAKDFRVFEDDKEQTITSFSRVTEGAESGTTNPKRYIVLFFDNSTMNTADQAVARKAAGEFVAQSASENRLMAVIDFSGVTHIAQNFTSNP